MTLRRRAGRPTARLWRARLTPRGSSTPLLALLPRQLTEAEVGRVADRVARLAGSASGHLGSVPEATVGAQIMRVTDELPRARDLEEVTQELARRGVRTHSRADLNS